MESITSPEATQKRAIARWVPPSTTLIEEAAEAKRRAAFALYQERKSKFSARTFAAGAQKTYGMDEKVEPKSSYSLGEATERLTTIVAANRAKEHELGALHGALLTGQRRASAVGAMIGHDVRQVLRPAKKTSEDNIIDVSHMLDAVEETNQVLRLAGLRLVQFAKKLQRAQDIINHYASLLAVPDSHIEGVFSTADLYEDPEALEESKVLLKEWVEATGGKKTLEL